MFFLNRIHNENFALQQRQQYKSMAYNGVKELIESGVKLLNESYSHHAYSSEIFENWIEYSQKIVELSTRDFDSNIYLNYLRFWLDLNRSYGHATSSAIKVKQCLEYLVNVLSMINTAR